MEFKTTEFEAMRRWLYNLSGSFEVRRARINLFDWYRYSENYEALYSFIEEMGGTIV